MNIKILKTQYLDFNLKKKIFHLKKQFWRFSLISQKKWFKKNIFKNDLHILLENKKKLIGYNCLRLNKFNSIKYFLLDTIIIDNFYRTKGLGNMLIKFNQVISDFNNSYIFLKSNKKTKKFYIKNDFHIIKNDKKYLYFIYGKKKLNKIKIKQIFNHAKTKYN